MNKKLIVIAIMLAINGVSLGKGETIKGITKEQQKEINKIIDKRVEQRLERLRLCLKEREKNRKMMKMPQVGIAEDLRFCLERGKLNK